MFDCMIAWLLPWCRGGGLTLITPLLKRDWNKWAPGKLKRGFTRCHSRRFESSRAGSLFKWGTLISFFLLFHFSLKLKLVFVSIERKLQHIRRFVQPRPQGFLLQKWEGVSKKPWTRLWLVVKLGCYYLVQFTTTLANDCLVLSFAAASKTSDSVMPSNGSFFTVVNTFDLEKKIRCGVN